MAQNEDVKSINEGAKDAGSAAVDRVLAVSRYADGTPAQSPGFKSVAPETTADISAQQLREQSASAADHAIRSAMIEGGAGEVHEDPVNKALREAIEKAGDAGQKKAEGEKVEG